MPIIMTKTAKTKKVVIKCNEFSDSVLLEVRRQKYFYVNTAVDKDILNMIILNL